MEIAWTEWEPYKEQAITELGDLIWRFPQENQEERSWASMAATIPEGDVPIMPAPLLEYLEAQTTTIWITKPPSVQEGLEHTFKVLSEIVTDNALERRAHDIM